MKVMKKVLKYFILILAIFLLGILIGKIVVLSISKENIANTSPDTISYDYPLEMNSYIPNNITKIKVSKFDTSNETHFTCYISDKIQIQNFIDSFNNIVLKDGIDNNIVPLYTIDFYGDSTLTAQVSSDKILQLSNSDFSKIFKISDDDLSNIKELTDVKYYLHDSSLEHPSESSCYNAQKIVLSGLSDFEITNLRNEIHNIHSLLEFYLVDHVQSLKDANSIYWEPATVDEVFTQPDGVKFQSYSFWQYRNSLQNILNSNINDTAKAIINDILYHLQYGMDNHDLSECFEAHKILHDLDYWIINYPIGSFTVAPTDWGGIKCYYGLIKQYNL